MLHDAPQPNSPPVSTLKDISIIQTGKTPPTSEKENYGGEILFVKPTDLDTSSAINFTPQTITQRGAEYCNVVPPLSVLVSCIGNIGKVAVLESPAAFNQQINSVTFSSDTTSHKFGYYALRTLRPWFEENSSATTISIINKSRFSEAPFPLPPLPEQIRIADKLDALLSRVNAGRERLERVPRLLKRFRQSVLSAAVSGELTREWRGGGDAEWEESQPIRNYTDLDVGYAFKSADFTSEGIRLLRGDNIEPSKLRWRDAKCMPAESLKDFGDYEVLAGDVILAMDRPIISSGLKIAVASEDDVPCMLVQRVCRFRPKRNIRARFLYIALNTEDFVRYLGDEQNGTQVPHISAKQIMGFEFLLPPLPEQTEIVRRVEALFAIADRIEARYQSALTTFNRLTPALLAKAFRGELVPQDPNDEPAAVLLERIRAARATSGDKPKRGRGAAKSAVGAESGSSAPDGAAPKRRGRPPKAQAEAPGIAQASRYEDAVRQLEAQKAARAAAGKLEEAQAERGIRQDGLFGNAEVNS